MKEKKKHYIVYQITNKLNNKIYIGVHITENINDKYMGSGSNIKKAIKEFGMENFEKIILFNFDNKEEMLEKERELVNDEFIKNGDTYNIILGGGFNTENIVIVKDKDDNTMAVHKTDPRYLSGELVGISKGLANLKDKNNDKYQVSINDKRFLSGELVHITCGLITVKDKYNKTSMVSIKDPRYLSGELVPIWNGKRHKDESKEKMSIAKKGKYKGQENSQYDTCWIHNLTIKESKKIKNDELDKWLSNGWEKGRKMKF